MTTIDVKSEVRLRASIALLLLSEGLMVGAFVVVDYGYECLLQWFWPLEAARPKIVAYLGHFVLYCGGGVMSVIMLRDVVGHTVGAFRDMASVIAGKHK